MDTSATDFSAQLERNLTDVFLQFSSQPGVVIIRESDCIGFTTGCDVNWMNGLLWSDIDVSRLAQRVSELLHYFQERGVSGVWKIGQYSGNRVELIRHLDSRGLQHLSDDPSMVLPLSDLDTKETPLKVSHVKTNAQLEDWLIPYASSFELSQRDVEFARCFGRENILNPHHPYQHFVGYIHDEPVSCASTFVHRELPAIYNVATSASMRGRGYGTAITGAAASFLKAAGARYVGLIASAMGLSVYQKMGFRKVGTITEFAI